ncbi:MAG: hypothetical protein WC707_02680 [Candidatus Babeliaceae bacterium]|jgi:tetratricopeptide (TPR) repeat protein
MTQFSSEKYNVAWFKLAEFVVRKEKERALYMYRLLAHSFPDEAFSAQLEGDLLQAFHDTKSVECYMRAADTYQKKDRFIEAIGVLEHVMTLNSTADCCLKLLDLYNSINNYHNFLQKIVYFFDTFSDYGDLQKLHDFLLSTAYTFSLEEQHLLFERGVERLLSYHLTDYNMVQKYLGRAIQCATPDQKRSFIEKLSRLDSQAYAYAVSCNE